MSVDPSPAAARRRAHFLWEPATGRQRGLEQVRDGPPQRPPAARRAPDSFGAPRAAVLAAARAPRRVQVQDVQLQEVVVYGVGGCSSQSHPALRAAPGSAPPSSSTMPRFTRQLRSAGRAFRRSPWPLVLGHLQDWRVCRVVPAQRVLDSYETLCSAPQRCYGAAPALRSAAGSSAMPASAALQPPAAAPFKPKKDLRAAV